MTLAAVDVSGLLELVWVAPLCAVAVTVSFSLCVLGATRSTDARRNGDGVLGAAWFTLASLAGLAVAAEVVAGILLIAGVWGGD
jgi:hypothetical protein